jgi:Cu-Zn family superoxide dismutase
LKRILFAAALAAAPMPSFAARDPVIVTPLQGPTGTIGMVRLEESPRGVLIRLEVQGLLIGWHGVHIHAVGRCEGPTFESAGGHVHQGAGPGGHGLLNPQGDDTGDLPSIYAGSQGVAQAEFFSTMVTLTGARGRTNLLDGDGSALVVHQNEDDQRTQPIGGAGPRVACAVIK